MIYKSLSPNKGVAYILDATYKRISSEGLKPINLGDMNADTMRLRYTNDRVMTSWLKRHSYTEISRLYVQPSCTKFIFEFERTIFLDRPFHNQ